MGGSDEGGTHWRGRVVPLGPPSLGASPLTEGPWWSAGVEKIPEEESVHHTSGHIYIHTYILYTYIYIDIYNPNPIHILFR